MSSDVVCILNRLPPLNKTILQNNTKNAVLLFENMVIEEIYTKVKTESLQPNKYKHTSFMYNNIRDIIVYEKLCRLFPQCQITKMMHEDCFYFIFDWS